MAVEDRLLRLENAFITLSELAGESQAHAVKLDARTARLEESFVKLTELAVITNERIDDQQRHVDAYQQWLEDIAAAQANTEVKLAALADAQIRTETIQVSTEEKMAALAESQIQTQKALHSLNQRFK